jgi:Vault protein inter-alpha-trypsin domain
LLIGFSLGLLGLVAAELPTAVTRIGLQMASSPDTGISQRGVKWLRNVGSQDVILRSCYQSQQGMTDLLSWFIARGNPVSQDEARRVYYRVTGVPFNAVKPSSKLNKQVRAWGDDFEFDSALGGTTVAGQVKGLSLATSRQDQSIDANAAVSYTEWTLVFKNISAQQREARAQVALPPGGVVSRLTLWVNGEEREAAFAGRAQVREAYNQVAIQQRRDPVLVTTSGLDRVLMQCFPVPPNGEMKVRLGITAPLQLESNEQATLPLPYLLERNFGLNDDAKHYVWIESKQPLTAHSADLKAEQAEGGKFALRGNLTEASLSESFVHATRTSAAMQSWAPDTLSKPSEIITQQIAAQPVTAPSRIVFVIDGSRPVKDRVSAIAATMVKLPRNVESLILFASDGVVDLSQGVQNISPDAFAQRLNEADFAGGNDNLPALLRAWDAAAEKPNSAIVWLHGAQPIEMQGITELRQRYQRRPNGPRIYDVQLIAGPNRLAEELETLSAVEPVPNRLMGLERLFATWNGQAARYVITRAKSPRINQTDAIESSSHLARLWANDEVKRMIAARAKPEDTIKLAANYQLVTSVTGAVVLETKEQYERAGLKPVNANTVPTIPEPETWALIAVVGTVLLWLFFQQRKGQRV